MKTATLLIGISLGLNVPLHAQEITASNRAHLSRIEQHLVPLAQDSISDFGPPPPHHSLIGQSWTTLAKRMQYFDVPGVSVAIMDNFRLVATGTYGFADREAQRPVTVTTRFQAGSISKPMATIAALRLSEQGLLRLDGKINDQLRTWQLPDNAFTQATPVTLKMLLNHTAGTNVSGYRGYDSNLRSNLPDTRAVLDGVAPANSPAVRVVAQPGQQFNYSGGGFVVAQQAMQDVSQQDFPTLMQRLVLAPLGMHASFYGYPALSDERVATGYTYHAGVNSPLQGRFHLHPEMAPAGLWSTPSDLITMARELTLARQGQSRVLSRGLAHTMLSKTAASFDDKVHSVGVGIFLDQMQGQTYVEHPGFNLGYQSFLIFNPATGQGAAVMTNAGSGYALALELVQAIAREYQWRDYAPTPVKPTPIDTATASKLVGKYQVNNGDPDPIPLEIVMKNGQPWIANTEAGQLFQLGPKRFGRADSGAVYWLEQDTLFVSEFGKRYQAERL